MVKLPLPLLKSIIFSLVICCDILITVPLGLGESVHIYKFRDSDGVLRFSDTAPDAGQTVKSQEALTSAPRPKIFLSRESKGKGRGDVIYARNDYKGPAEVVVQFLSIVNVEIINNATSIKGKNDDVRRYILTRTGNQAVFAVKPTTVSRPSHYKFNYRYLPGDPRTAPNDQFNYLAPIAPDASFPISQAFNGPFSHQNAHNRYAVDIVMPVKTPIHCARGGVVMEVMDEYFWAGKNLTYYGPRSNLIRILHEDGTMALYVHLWRGSAVVRAGQRVTAGEIIARSGNSGYSSGPHLHFSILVNKGMEVVSLPFQFKGPSGQGTIPVRGLLLTHAR